MRLTYALVKDILTNPQKWDVKLKRLLVRADRAELIGNIHELNCVEHDVDIIESVRACSTELLEQCKEVKLFATFIFLDWPHYYTINKIALVLKRHPESIRGYIKRHCQDVLNEAMRELQEGGGI